MLEASWPAAASGSGEGAAVIRSKRCSRCRLTKVAACFWVKKPRTGQLKSQCKGCHGMTRRESWRRRWPERKAIEIAKVTAWRKANRHLFRERQRLQQQRRRAAAKEERAWYLRRSA